MVKGPRIRDGAIFGPKWTVYITPCKGQGTSRKKNQKELGEKDTCAKRRLLGITRTGHNTGAHKTCTSLGSSTFHHEKRKGSRNPAPPEGLLTVNGILESGICFFHAAASNKLPMFQ